MVGWTGRAGRTAVLIGALVVALTAAVPSAGASENRASARTETLRFSVPTALVLQVEHLMTVVHGTTKLAAIWPSALCASPPEPIPKQVKSNGAASHFEVTIVRSHLTSLKATLTEDGCSSLLADYQSSLRRFLKRLQDESAIGDRVTTTTTTTGGRVTTGSPATTP